MPTKPNLFDFATSELSQDAFLMWLMAWADEGCENHDSALNSTGKEFIECLFLKTGINLKPPYSTMLVKQWQNMDIIAIINNSHAILIEDKKFSGENNDQLSRYAKIISDGIEIDGVRIDKNNIAKIYFTTGEKCITRSEMNGFVVVHRKALEDILKKSKSNNDILKDFSSNLATYDDSVQSFKTMTFDNWRYNWDAWTGFYNFLMPELSASNPEWGYVSNPQGGFLAFYFHGKTIDGMECYLQIEMEKFCFKIAVSDKDRQYDLMYKWSEKLIKIGQSLGLDIIKPRLRKGSCMTVAILNGVFPPINHENSKIDLPATLALIQTCMKVIDMAEKE